MMGTDASGRNRLAGVGRRIVVGFGVVLGLVAAAALILIHAARSHFPIMLFAAFLLAALAIGACPPLRRLIGLQAAGHAVASAAGRPHGKTAGHDRRAPRAA